MNLNEVLKLEHFQNLIKNKGELSKSLWTKTIFYPKIILGIKNII